MQFADNLIMPVPKQWVEREDHVLSVNSIAAGMRRSEQRVRILMVLPRGFVT